MIRLAGMVPYEDIDIEFTGLRPGEKLFEEINGKTQSVSATCHEKIQVLREQPMNWPMITGWIGELEELLAARQEPEVIAHIQRMVPEYTPAAKWLCDQSRETLAGKPGLPDSQFAVARRERTWMQ
jgi:FlaA1/EpsC-like NDP-sugar epimerase